MPKNPSGLLPRKGRYYLHIRIPKDLLPAYPDKKSPFITRSLNTSVRKEAIARLTAARMKQETEFEARRREMRNGKSSRKIQLSDLSEGQREAIVQRWLQDEEAWSKKSAREVEVADEDGIIDNLQQELAHFGQELEQREYMDGSRTAAQILEEKGIEKSKSAKEFQQLAKLFSKAHYESILRHIQRIQNEPVTGTGDILFASIQNGGSNKDRDIRTFAEVCDEYKTKRAERLKPRSIADMEVQLDILKQLIPAEKAIQTINRAMCKAAAEEIRKIPSNASKKYPGKSIKAAIELAKRDGQPTLHPKRANTYIDRMKAVFQFACDEEYIETQPANSLTSPINKTRKARLPFTTEQLAKIFTSPLYSGCMDDENRYMQKGPNRPRRIRFWLSLIALWSGLRLEEICQLFVDDVYSHHKVHVIAVRPDEDSDEKGIKTPSGVRLVPVHPELIKLGFLEYVNEMKSRGEKKLFPEISRGADGTLGLKMSKWFGRYLDNLDLTDKRLTFHSFRHNLAQALKEVGAPDPIANFLSGWRDGGSMYAHYSGGEAISQVYKHLKKVKYPNLDLSHLYV